MDVLWVPVGVGEGLSITLDLSIPQEYLAQRRFSEFAIGLDHYHVNHIIFWWWCCSSQFRIKTVLKLFFLGCLDWNNEVKICVQWIDSFSDPFHLQEDLFLSTYSLQGIESMNFVVSMVLCFCFWFISGLCEADYFIAHSLVCEVVVDAVYSPLFHAHLWPP